jgi:hypothetical protein
MRMLSNRWMMTCCCAALLTAGGFARPEPAQAQSISVGGFGISIGGLLGGGRYQRGGGRSRAARSSSKSESESSSSDSSEPSSRKDRKDQVLASKGAPSAKEQVAILQFVAASENLGVVGSTKDLEQAGRARSKEGDRDYTGKIKKIIERFKNEQKNERNTRPGDVTEQAIEESLEKAFNSAKLATFEKFVGENWSTERLRVMILDLASAELGRLFDGNNRGNAPMLALDSLIQRSAQSVFRRIFETSELLAANRSAAYFTQRLYQTHGSLLDDNTRESADGIITRAAIEAVAKYDPLLRQDENVFALRYRAQRIVLDCLSAHIEDISSSNTAMRTINEIGKKVTLTSDKACTEWLNNQFVAEGARRDNQFGAEGARRNNQVERARLSPQQPVPVRAVWAADGPTFDQSIIGRPGGAF